MDPRQRELDNFRKKLNQNKWIIWKDDATPFSDSLRDWCRTNNMNYHFEVDYEGDIFTLYFTVDTETVVSSGHISKMDEIEDAVAKKFVAKINEKIFPK